MNLFLLFWTVTIFASIVWYFFLLFYVAAKGGGDIIRMTRALRRRDSISADGPASTVER